MRRLNPNLPPNEFSNGVGHVLVVAPQPVDPTNNQGATFPQNIEQPFPLGSFPEPRGEP
jgi:hypothetical protein